MTNQTSGDDSRRAMFVPLIGMMSFFTDFTYEGARSILGPFPAAVGASATIIGIVVGFGELLGYGLRVVSGTMADATQRFWPITIFGYVVQMAAVPALASIHSWEAAACLIILERVGKAIRNPPRDVMLSNAEQRSADTTGPSVFTKRVTSWVRWWGRLSWRQCSRRVATTG